MTQKFSLSVLAVILSWVLNMPVAAQGNDDHETMRIFIFAGQSNMVGSDSKVGDIKRFPPYAGLEDPQEKVLFTYCLGRENKKRSEGWVALQHVNNVVGPELSFARRVTGHIKAPVGIIKVAAGGTHLGGDWNPDKPIGFKMYPLALETIGQALAGLKERGIKYRLEGFMWHQGENDMFNEDYMKGYGGNLKNFLASWRRDLKTPDLKFYIGELCTKTIWGMDLRPRMYAISLGQREVTAADSRAEYVPTSHVGAEIGRPVGLHYHYGTLGQLQHGENYATAYLRTIGLKLRSPRPLGKWPYAKGSAVKLFILAGHRNMEGERAFVQELEKIKGGETLLKDNAGIAYKYDLGGGYHRSRGWEPLGLTGYYDTFGPELSFARTVAGTVKGNIAIAKFTHSGSQIIDWTPEGSMAKSRHIYPEFIRFVKDSIAELSAKGHEVEVAGIFYHMGENDMSFHPYRKEAAARVQAIIEQSRKDLKQPGLRWFVSQQPPTDVENLNKLDVVGNMAKVASADPNLIHLKAFDLPPQEKMLVITTGGIVQLGEFLAKGYLGNR
ncbi:MAG: sialate O-acetylesterase [Roseibacillus sp.]|nr:sialate O-acetylesterase [Roseibacillus sp.]